MQKSTILVCLAIALTVAAVSAAVGAGSTTNLKEALLAQIELAEQQPTDSSVLNDLGNLLALAGDLERAEEAYRRAVELDPQGVTPRFNLALLLQQGQDIDAAVHQLRRVIELDPEHGWAHYQLGAIQEARGMEKQATRSYARAFAIDPNLSFPEVNPHIIENKLVVSALLQAYRGQDDPSAPKSYDDARRIASLLAPEPTFSVTWEPPAEVVENVDATVEQADAQFQSQPGEVRFEDSGEEQLEDRPEEPRQLRVLTEQDLKPGRVNQVSAPGRSSRRGQQGGTRLSNDTQAARLRTWSRSRNSATPQGGAAAGSVPRRATPQRGEMQPGGNSASQRSRDTSIRSRFRPGLRSTGSLDTELVRETVAKPAFG